MRPPRGASIADPSENHHVHHQRAGLLTVSALVPRRASGAAVKRLRQALAVTLAASLTLPASAFSHGLVGKQDLPIPRWLFGWAASVVLVISFVALAVLWPTPRWQRTPERRVAGLQAALDVICGLIGVALFALVIYAGLAGVDNPTRNLLPTVVFVLFWVGIPFVSVLLGDVFRAFNPWLAIGRLTGWVARRVAREPPPRPLPYPPWLGRWPAAAGIVAFVWIELVYSGREHPRSLAILALAYAVVQFVGMSLYGTGPWSRNADAFGVYFGLFARLAPLRWTRRALFVRSPISDAASLAVLPGTVTLLCVMIGTTSFDGFTQGPVWGSIVGGLQQAFVDAGLSIQHALEATFTLGMIAAVAVIVGLYRLGIAGVRSIDGERSSSALAGLFVHSLIPIALAYVVAHYFGLLAYQGQALGYLASDPLGTGSDLFGTAGATIDYGVLSATTVWYVQVAVLVAGHAAGLALAHDRAVAIYDDKRVATQSQYWMLAVMITFTTLALWLLSAGS